ncbi:hypothetical protein MP638_004733 [Amoeboaphelidium occidentale]|nr:hypothetical protein MP638_004733 [Amoeboaphelidium occidentale]
MCGLEIGGVIGLKYIIINECGSGAFAKVYKAQHIETRSYHAVKVLCKKELDPEHVDIQRLEILHNERLKQNGMDCKNVVLLDDFFETDEHIFMVFEYAECGDLCDLLALRPLSEHEILQFFDQVLAAVKYCHQNGVYHRDIKPENILLFENGDVKLCDFGLSTTENYSFNHGIGTAAYMAPEVYGDGGEFGEPYAPVHADLWSLGCLLISMITRRTLWDYASKQDFRYNDFMKNPSCYLKEGYKVNDQVLDVISLLLKKDPVQRGCVHRVIDMFDQITEIYDYADDYYHSSTTIRSRSVSQGSWISEESLCIPEGVSVGPESPYWHLDDFEDRSLLSPYLLEDVTNVLP